MENNIVALLKLHFGYTIEVAGVGDLHFSENSTYQKDSRTVLYRSKMNPNLKRNFGLFPVLDWIAEITVHIPNKEEQLVRYYAAYSNVSRGRRKKEGYKKDVIGKPEFVEVIPLSISKELKRRWSHFIQKVYETDPLICLKWALAPPLRRPTTGRHIFPKRLVGRNPIAL